MLAPDINTVEDCMQSSMSTSQAITRYAQAITTLVPAYLFVLSGPWKNLQSALQNVVHHAQMWPNNLCASYTQGVPNLLTTYNDAFQRTAKTLFIQDQILRKNPHDVEANNALEIGLQTLKKQLQALQKPLLALTPEVAKFETAMKGDHAYLDQIVGELASTVPGADQVIGSLQSLLEEPFFSCNILAPCHATVEMKSSVAVQLRLALRSAPPVVPVVILQALLEQMESANEAMANNLADVVEVFSVLEVKLQVVLEQLQRTEAEQMADFLQQLALKDAALAWRQLAAYTEGLGSTAQSREHSFA
jgi:hypothetical protein